MNRGGILVQGELYTISLLLMSIQVFMDLKNDIHRRMFTRFISFCLFSQLFRPQRSYSYQQ